MSAADAVEQAFDRIERDGRAGIWIALADRRSAAAAAADVDRRVARGESLPLAGTTLAVKDNIDVAGMPTTAGCPAYAYDPERSAGAVVRLLAAGAVVIGKTNLDQFATGLVGVRSPYGICPNAHWPGLIAGGSSAGSAVAVAAGMVDVALGTDTAGSGRVPAACNGIVGLKPTRGRIGASGVVPACRSLDCVSVFARTVDAADAVAAVAAGPDDDDPWSRPQPEDVPLARDSFPSRHSRCRRADVRRRRRRTRSLPRLHGQRGGGRLRARPGRPGAVPRGRGAALRRIVRGRALRSRRRRSSPPHRDEVDPVVGAIIAAAGALPAWHVFRDRTELVRLGARISAVWDHVDAVVVPSVPRTPTVAEVLAEPVGVNTMLGTYTNFVNLLDLAAVTIPTEPATAVRPPASVTLIGPAWSDAFLAALGAMLGTPTTLHTP